MKQLGQHCAVQFGFIPISITSILPPASLLFPIVFEGNQRLLFMSSKEKKM